MFSDRPGLWFVTATALPLAAAAGLAVAGLVRRVLKADRPGPAGGYVATAAIALACVCSVVGLLEFRADPAPERWNGRVAWARVGNFPGGLMDRLDFGYHIDSLSAYLFVMITLVATLIHVFSLGYMRAEAEPSVTDHEVPNDDGHGHFHRRGRFGRFFLYMALFCFSMLNLVLADNLLQVFVSWELVGVCSYFLIGFYTERPSAAQAAVKAFVVNRVGDAGFIMGLCLLWTFAGTLNIQELQTRLRSPAADSHGKLEMAGKFVRVEPQGEPTADGQRYVLPKLGEPEGSYVALFPVRWPDPTHYHGLGYAGHNDRAFRATDSPQAERFGAIPYGLLMLAGLGLFLGCMGKSAQFPLHVWLPDAMEGPTPVSALIHAATMVAAGVYLAGRVFFVFTPEALVVIAYVGAITLAGAALIALVMTDIKRVLAYSTVSQLGYMMLALGVGGWVAGLLHLLTHAFFKALLFLAAGSVIHACHHEQDMRKMGGLLKKLPVTALTMLVGVLAISGTPFFSGWYSKDAILADALGFGEVHERHWALFLVPLAAAGLTACYMLRMWFLTFTGQPRNHYVYDAAHESPLVMTVPLIVLAAFSVGVAWGWPPHHADASWLAEQLKQSEPAAVPVGFAQEQEAAHEGHSLAGWLALAVAAAGAAVAMGLYWRPVAVKDRLLTALWPARWLLVNKFFFDEIYQALFVTTTVDLATGCRQFDKADVDGPKLPAPATQPDWKTLDGWATLPAAWLWAIGGRLRGMQTGRLRGYIVVLVLTAVALFAILSILVGRAGAG
jgi:NADH-quinone oxidoreductase subunit L